MSPVPLDHRRARLEHRSLRARLERAGVGVRVLPPLPGHPDAAFVEDAAIVLPELTVLCRPGAPSRRGEVAAVAEALPGGRPLRRIRAPGTLEGGDAVLLGRTLLVGRSTRTNETGIATLADLLSPHGYAVRPVAVHGALHLRTACTQVGDGVLLCRPAWLDADGLAVAAGGELRELIPVAEEEPWAANTLHLAGRIWMAAGSPRTAGRLRSRGLRVEEVEISEFRKAEAGVSCLILRLARRAAGRRASA